MNRNGEHRVIGLEMKCGKIPLLFLVIKKDLTFSQIFSKVIVWNT